jgi:hypothetical protein
MQISDLIKTDNRPPYTNGDFYKFDLFYDKLIEGINNITYTNSLSGFKTYYCSGLIIPKDRIKVVEKKFGLKKVLDPNKADVIFSDRHNIKSLLSEYIEIPFYSLYNHYPAGVSYEPRKHASLIYLNYKNLYKAKEISIIDSKNYKFLEFVISKRAVDNTIKSFNHYMIGKPIFCISDICEDDFPILYQTDFYNNYFHRLISSNTAHLAFLSLYSKYSAHSIKSNFNYILKLNSNNSFLNINGSDKIKFSGIMHDIRNKDVYTKYILKDLSVVTSNSDIKTLYYFNIMSKKYMPCSTYSNKKYLKSKFLGNKFIDRIVTKVLNSKFFSFSMDNLSTTNKPEGYVLLSSQDAIQKIESDLINFKILPESEKDKLINILLDMMNNLTQVDRIVEDDL